MAGFILGVMILSSCSLITSLIALAVFGLTVGTVNQLLGSFDVLGLCVLAAFHYGKRENAGG